MGKDAVVMWLLITLFQLFLCVNSISLICPIIWPTYITYMYLVLACLITTYLHVASLWDHVCACINLTCLLCVLISSGMPGIPTMSLLTPLSVFI